jgi:hypothetical protein
MDFKTFFFGLSVAERDLFAGRAHTSRGLLTQVAYKNKRIELGFADVLIALSGGQVTLDELPLTDNATRQRGIRDVRRELIGTPDASPVPEAQSISAVLGA